MSHSMFTRSRTFNDESAVLVHVNGMIITSNTLPPSPATVRLTPSTAIDPLRIRYGERLRSNEMVSQCESPSGRISSTIPVPSTCPCTKWPPTRPSARIDRSRFTRCSGRSDPSVVTLAVSGPTSACTSPLSAAMTVRQTPLTARLSPGDTSAASAVRMRMRNPPDDVFSSPTLPTASMRPVNISLDKCIGPEQLDLRFDQRRQRPPPPAKQRNAFRPQRYRRHIQLDVVDHIFVPGRGVETGAALEQHTLNPVLRQ